MLFVLLYKTNKYTVKLIPEPPFILDNENSKFDEPKISTKALRSHHPVIHAGNVLPLPLPAPDLASCPAAGFSPRGRKDVAAAAF